MRPLPQQYRFLDDSLTTDVKTICVKVNPSYYDIHHRRLLDLINVAFPKSNRDGRFSSRINAVIRIVIDHRINHNSFRGIDSFAV